MIFIYTTVTEDDDVVTFCIGRVYLSKEFVEGSLESGGFDTLASRALNHRRCSGG